VRSPALLSDMGITAVFCPCGIFPLDLMLGFSPFSIFCGPNSDFHAVDGFSEYVATNNVHLLCILITNYFLTLDKVEGSMKL
jgi:hypothetical protein